MAPSKAGMEKGKLVGAVVQAIRILRALEQSDRPLGVSVIARAAQVNPSTAFNILRTLAAEEMVTFDEATKSYRLGAGLLKLAKGLFGQSVASAIKPEIQRLATESGCLVGLWQLVNDRMILIDRAVADRPIRLDVESKQRLPIMHGAVGRAVAASLKLTDAQLKAHFKRLRWEGEIEMSEYIHEVREAEKLGYSVDREILYRGIVSIGAAITDRHGHPLYGLTASDLASNLSASRTSEIGKRMARLGRTFSGEEG